MDSVAVLPPPPINNNTATSNNKTKKKTTKKKPKTNAIVKAPSIESNPSSRDSTPSSDGASSRDPTPTPEDWGKCFKCNKTILNEDDGCRAMKRNYHNWCFACFVCGKELRLTRFYPVKNKPMCEDDYLKTRDTCSVCQKPIMDRILRAMKKSFHPGCFRCSFCQRQLEGRPYLVDDEKIYCIDDYGIDKLV